MPANPPAMKCCTKCGEWKGVEAFGRHKSRADGLRICCRPCNTAAAAAWQKANPDKKKASYAAWKNANPDKKKASDAAWVRANPDKKKASDAAWKTANPDKAKANYAAWKNANSDKVKASKAAWAKANPNKARQIKKRVVDSLGQSYVAGLLGLPVSEVTQDILKLKREQILNERALRELKQTLKELQHDDEKQ